MIFDVSKIEEVLKAARSPTKRSGSSKPFKPSKKQLWALMKNGASRKEIMEVAGKGTKCFNEFFGLTIKAANKFKAANDGEGPCPGSVLGVLAAAEATAAEVEVIKAQTAAEAYESVAEYLPNGCPAYAAEALMGVFGFPYDRIRDLDEAQGKAALRMAEDLEEDEAEKKADSSQAESKKAAAKPTRNKAK